MEDTKQLVVVEEMSEEQFAEIEYKLKSGEFEISIDSPVFTKFWAVVNKQLRSLARDIEGDDFEAGSIAMKIEIIGEHQENPDVYDVEEGTAVMRPYTAPCFKMTSNVTRKKVEKEKITMEFNSHEIISKGHKVIAVPVSTAQMKLSDVEEGTQEE